MVSIMPEVADDKLLKKILNDYGLNTDNINIVEGEDDDVEYIKFDGKIIKDMRQLFIFF